MKACATLIGWSTRLKHQASSLAKVTRWAQPSYGTRTSKRQSLELLCPFVTSCYLPPRRGAKLITTVFHQPLFCSDLVAHAVDDPSNKVASLPTAASFEHSSLFPVAQGFNCYTRRPCHRPISPSAHQPSCRVAFQFRVLVAQTSLFWTAITRPTLLRIESPHNGLREGLQHKFGRFAFACKRRTDSSYQ